MRCNWLLVAVWTFVGSAGGAATISEDFATDPVSRGWRTFGDGSLFRWGRANQGMEVTWDSSRSNSFFYLPLGTILAKSDDFSFSFDLRLRDIQLGVTPGRTNTFEIGIGLLNSRSITNANYFRGAGQSATYGVRNLVEFDYFPEAEFITATIATTVVSTNNRIKPVHNFPLALTPGDLFRISLNYTASNQMLNTSATRNGAPFGMSPGNTLGDLSLAGHPDFRVDAFGVSSYSDAIQADSPNYWGSVLAHATIDNVTITMPGPPLEQLVLSISNSVPRVTFSSRTNWTYTLQRSVDAVNWNVASGTVPGSGGSMFLADTNGVAGIALYRVRVERP